MCGIFFCCNRDGFALPSPPCIESLRKRGPDSEFSVSRSFPIKGISPQGCSPEQGTLSLTFVSTVLSLRGSCIVRQPLEDQESGSLLCWNGEAWRVRDKLVGGNDSQVVFDLLLESIQDVSSEKALQSTVSAMATIVGPYSFIFYDARHHRVFYGRDVLGRRSLTIKEDLPGSLVISSICDPMNPGRWAEIEANGIYLLDLQKFAVPSMDPLRGVTYIPSDTENLHNGLRLTLVQSSFLITFLLRILTTLSQTPFRASTAILKAVEAPH